MGEQSNITLRFDAEDAGAEKGMQRLEQAERKMEVAVKVGNKTLRERINTEADLSKVLDKVRAGEEHVATAAQRRARASLAAQKSAALLAELNAKAAREQRMATGWEAAAARASSEADRRNHERLMKRKAEMAEAMSMQRGLLGRSGAAAVAFAGNLLGVGAAAGTVALALREVGNAAERSMAMARRASEQAKGLKEFVALQAPGEAGKRHVQETLSRGAAMGLTPEQTAALAQPIQSVTDTDGSGSLEGAEKANFDEDLSAAARLVQMGISPEDAQTVITSGRSRGRGGKVSADKLIAASDVSAAGPKDFARAASAMGQFEDSDTALAVATALTQEEKNFEQIPTLVRGAALSLGRAADDSELSKKFGLQGLSEAEKIAKLREIGARQGRGDTEEARVADFSRSLKNYGLDEEKARAVGILVRQADSVESTRSRLAEVTPGLADAKVAGLESDPLVGPSMTADKAAAAARLRDLYGPAAEEARQRRAAAFATGARLQEDGGGQAVDPETGEAKPWYTWEGFSGRFEAQRQRIARGERANIRSFFTGEAEPTSGGDSAVLQALESLRASLDANTEATRGNSAAAKKGGPVGGNPANAEEKY